MLVILIGQVGQAIRVQVTSDDAKAIRVAERAFVGDPLKALLQCDCRHLPVDDQDGPACWRLPGQELACGCSGIGAVQGNVCLGDPAEAIDHCQAADREPGSQDQLSRRKFHAEKVVQFYRA
jgi:hypothetical protein